MDPVRQETIEKVMARAETLPTIPAASSKILALLEDPDTGPEQIEAVIRYEPGLTANILKLTNSAYFGLPAKIGSIRQAVVLLGWRRVGQLVTTSCLGALLQRSVPGYDLPSGGMLRHAIAVAVASEEIVRALSMGEAEEVYTAALLHDVGKLVLGRFVMERREAIDKAVERGVPFESAEEQVLGVDHAQIGARLLESWSLPEQTVETVRWHHHPDSAGPVAAMVDVVHVADVTCLMIGQGLGWEGLQYEPSPAAVERLGLDLRQLEKIASRTLSWVDEISDALAAG